MGASNPHPHCQIWSTASTPDIPKAEREAQIAYRKTKNSCLLCIITRSILICDQNGRPERTFSGAGPLLGGLAVRNHDHFKRHLGAIDELDSNERNAPGNILKRLTTRYDNLFQTSFPPSMGFHQRPTDSHEHPEWHFHAHTSLRSATVQKFMVGLNC